MLCAKPASPDRRSSGGHGTTAKQAEIEPALAAN
jgi:hypothetical protein